MSSSVKTYRYNTHADIANLSYATILLIPTNDVNYSIETQTGGVTLPNDKLKALKSLLKYKKSLDEKDAELNLEGFRFLTKTQSLFNPFAPIEGNSVINVLVDKNLTYIAGNSIIVTSLDTPLEKKFEATVVSYNHSTGMLSFTNILNLKGIWSTNTPSAINLDGIDGQRGATGIQGHTGIQGPTGAAGQNGQNGATGAMGPTGAAGQNGQNGINGADGATGPTGAAGQNGQNGQNGATGAAGQNGQNGINGADGATGPTGAAGQNGTNGQNGADGATGPTGAAGQNGTNGADGATGPTGAAGQNGTNGQNGQNGADGATGPTGAAGQNGINGADGATGPTGVAGQNGTNGADGASGAMGPTGADGPTGQRGITAIVQVGDTANLTDPTDGQPLILYNIYYGDNGFLYVHIPGTTGGAPAEVNAPTGY